MVMKNSEYRNSFKPTVDIQVQVYEQNLDFRTTRKSAEFIHNPSAFSWEAQDWEKGSQTSVLEDPRPGTAPAFKYKHKLYNKLYNENQLRNTVHPQCPVHSNVVKNDESPQIPVSSPEAENIDDNSLAVPSENINGLSNTEIHAKESCIKKPHRPQQHVTSKKMTDRPTSAPVKPKSSAISPRDISSRAPFVLYGSKDKEYHIGELKTHNIRASTDVYPSALRAKRYRETEKERKLKSAPVVKRKPLTFDQIMDKQTSCWQTEYKGHFVTYDKTEYQKSISSRLGVRRSAPDA